MVGIGMPGMTEWIVILVIVLIFFGAGKLPEVFSQAGKGLRAFKDAADGKEDDRKRSDDESAPPRARRQLESDDDLDDASGSAAPKVRARDDAR